MEKTWTYCAVYSIIQIHFVRGLWEEKIKTEDIYALPGSDVNLTCQTQKKGFMVQTQWSKITKRVDLVALYHPQHGFHCADGVPFTLDEWRSNNTMEIEINQTLKIPCLQNISSEISSEFTFAWLVEDNGTQETLITQGHPISNSTLFKDRVKLGADYGLYLSPVQIHDNDRRFSCHVTIRPGKILRSSTTVKVFAKPEISMTMEKNSMDMSGKRTFTCSLRNVFPTANLTWFIDTNFPQSERQETNVPHEERKDKSGFLDIKSVFTRERGNETAQSDNLTIWCMAWAPVPGNKVWNMSSEKITFSFGSVNPPTDPAPSITEPTLGTQTSPANSISPTRHPATSSAAPVNVSTLTASNTPEASWIPSETYSSFPSSAGWTLHDDNFTSTTEEFSEVPTTSNRSTKNYHIHVTGIVVNKPKEGMSWPVIVAALLFFCLVLFGLGVRKWCQYLQEIMERPPPFKPPPPPVKYTCIQESSGSDLPCHEMETLQSSETLPYNGTLLESY
ncbi:T-cell surface protein tactile isoform 2-T2 [Molossus nigricans]